MAEVILKNINKVYDGGVHAVHDFNMEIKDGEFIVFVGPSGCGKSTTLRMIAGLEEITYGELYIDGKLVNNVAPKDRQIAMVFQSYALYPQMTVYENIAYSLKLKHVPKKEIHERVLEVSKILGLDQYLDRKPRNLSGGQRQRVALGRAIIRNPRVFLMDEPLSNLDAKLRVAMRSEIVRIHEETKATTVYVTHDQVEAMTMADRIVVMKDGYVQQIGTPEYIYANPKNRFVAGFIGAPASNFIEGKISEDGKTFLADETNLVINLTPEQQELLKNFRGHEVTYGIRPEHLIYKEDGDYGRFSNQVLSLNVKIVELLGDVLNCYCHLTKESNIVFKTTALNKIKAKSTVNVAINTDFSMFFNTYDGNAITKEDNEYNPPVVEETEEVTGEVKKVSFFDKIKGLFSKKDK